MSGHIAARSEIARRAHQMLIEMPAPDAVYDHARGERSGVAEDFVRQLEPPGALLEGLARILREHRQESPRHDFARRYSRRSATEERQIARHARLEHHRRDVGV